MMILSNSSGVRQTSRRAHADLEILLPVRRRLSQLTRRDYDVLLLQRGDDVGGGQARAASRAGSSQMRMAYLRSPKMLDVANAGYALQGVLDIDIEIVADEQVGDSLLSE